ncbi:hypothetical protein [Deinococcus sp.]|uniref:hypothetical protein n=1 Tax=Deinococcus sp. TaxID=47478 RepID=UPI0025F53C91|nr:hypothetical protein [Deinococcus sp.]
MKHLHVPLSEALHATLMQVAKESGESATALARKAIEEILWQREQAKIRAEMRAYALAVAGSIDDFDPELERAGLEVWAADE